MKRFLIAAAYGLGGLALAAVVSVAAFAATDHQLSDPTEPISIGRSRLDQAGAGGDASGSGAGQNGQPAGSFTPSWSPSPGTTGGGDDHPSGSGSDDSSGSDSHGSGSDDSSGSGSDGSGSDDPPGSDDSSGSGGDHSGGGSDDD